MGVIDRQGRLGQKSERVRICRVQRGDILERFHQGHLAFLDLAESADHLGVIGVAHENDMAACFGLPFRLTMDLGYQGTGRIEIFQTTLFGFMGNSLGHAVRRKNDRHAIGHFVQFLDKYRAHFLQFVDNIAVVDDFVPDIDRCAIFFNRQLDDFYGAVDACAKAARRCHKQVNLPFLLIRMNHNQVLRE